MSMDDLERRAVLGDRQAQDECTRQGIALPCPICHNPVDDILVKAGALPGEGVTYNADTYCL